MNDNEGGLHAGLDGTTVPVENVRKAPIIDHESDPATVALDPIVSSRSFSVAWRDNSKHSCREMPASSFGGNATPVRIARSSSGFASENGIDNGIVLSAKPGDHPFLLKARQSRHTIHI